MLNEKKTTNGVGNFSARIRRKSAPKMEKKISGKETRRALTVSSLENLKPTTTTAKKTKQLDSKNSNLNKNQKKKLKKELNKRTKEREKKNKRNGNETPPTPQRSSRTRSKTRKSPSASRSPFYSGTSDTTARHVTSARDRTFFGKRKVIFEGTKNLLLRATKL